VAQTVELLSSNGEALSSNPNTEKNKQQQQQKPRIA
jgi:hypothetical protein